jgi:hypothetical protein
VTRRTSAEVQNRVRRVDVLDVAVLKVVGGVRRVEAFGGDGRRVAPLILDADGVLEAVRSEDVFLVGGSRV